GDDEGALGGGAAQDALDEAEEELAVGAAVVLLLLLRLLLDEALEQDARAVDGEQELGDALDLALDGGAPPGEGGVDHVAGLDAAFVAQAEEALEDLTDGPEALAGALAGAALEPVHLEVFEHAVLEGLHQARLAD